MSSYRRVMMDCHQKHEKSQRQYYSEDCSYGDYMIAVDEHLEKMIGRSSNQDELAYIADLQEEFFTPEEAAETIAQEKFSKPWKIRDV